MKFNFDPTTGPTTDTGFYIDLWKTKPIPVNATTTKDLASNIYRSDRQAITTQPVASLERQGTTTPGVRVIFGAGKHEDVDGDWNDNTDVAKTSLYNLRDDIYLAKQTNFSGTNMVSGTCTNAPAINFKVRSNCESTTYRCTGSSTDGGCTYGTAGAATSETGCHWAIPQGDGTAVGDCCENSCAQTSNGPCWDCVFDLIDTGEKVINKPLIAGGVVFFTTFIPIAKDTDQCSAGGNGYLYAFDYMCGVFPPGFNPIAELGTNIITMPGGSGTSGSSPPIYGARVDLGAGVPSQPVLDSSGKFLIVQSSVGSLQRVKVNLLTPPSLVKGWKEK